MKRKLTVREWIEIGNRIKAVREELMSLGCALSPVLNKKTTVELITLVERLDRWKYGGLFNTIDQQVYYPLSDHIISGNKLPIEAAETKPGDIPESVLRG